MHQEKGDAKKKTGMAIGFIIAVLGFSCVAVFGYWAGILPRYDKLQEFYAPIFSEDDAFVYYLTRESSGFSWGPGWESFTPPAKVVITQDRFCLERTSLKDARTDSLYTLEVPHTFTPQSRYRNRLFGVPFVELMWEGRNLRFRISVDADKENRSERTRRLATVGTWYEHNSGVKLKQQWKTDSRVFIPWNRHILSGEWEVVSIRGRAILLVDKDWQRKIVLRSSETGMEKAQDILDSLQKEQYSHRDDIERNELVKSTHARILMKFKEKGLQENEALLSTSDEMERLGLYPKGPKIIAREAVQQKEGVPVFHISEHEFFVGMFQDVDRAIREPGIEIDFWGNYVRHRDFDTSEKLNGFLRQGGTEFYVETGGKMYVMKVEKN